MGKNIKNENKNMTTLGIKTITLSYIYRILQV